MATAGSRPTWTNEHDAIDMGADVDAEVMADIEKVMATRVNPELKFGQGAFDPGKPAAWRPDEVAVPPAAAATLPATESGIQAPPADAAPASGAEGVGTGTGGAVAPGATEDKPLPPPAPGSTPADAPGETIVIPETFNVKTPTGDIVPIDNDQANYLIQLHNWVSSLPDETRQQWRAIEIGEATAVPVSDYEAFKAWKASQQTPATPPVPNRPAGYDPSLVDGDTAEYIARLEAAARTAAAAPPVAPATTTPTPSQADIDFRIQAEATRRLNFNTALEAAVQETMTAYGLTDEQVAHLRNVTPGLNIIPAIAEKRKRYTPTGVPLEPDHKAVLREAFDVAMSMDPTLRTIRDNMILQQHLASQQTVASNVATKKANAGSLATAPSAAVPGREVDMSKMTKAQRENFAREQMTAELAEAMAGN